MTFLPIVERELRVAARRRSSFWLRVVAALVTSVIGGGFLTVNILFAKVGGGGVPLNLGSALFGMLTWMSLAAILCAGLFFTSDCMSEEKRDGTLGLLFLTDLRGYDVVLGKLLATSLRVFYGLLATFPILAVALLLGGVTGGECGRKMLSLASTLFFSLAAGMLVSTFSRNTHKAMAGTFLLVLAFVALPPIGDVLWCDRLGRSFTPRASLISPGFNFYIAGNFKTGPFWISLAATHAIGWLFLALAAVSAPRTWQVKAAGTFTTRSRRLHRWKFGSVKARAARRRQLLSQNPVLWLACRERWQGGMISVGLLALTGLLFLPVLFGGTTEWLLPVSAIGVWLVGFVMNLWMASQAPHFFVEARRSGAMELLLASPLTVNEVVRGQWLALRRLFGLPVALLLVLQLTLTVAGTGMATFSISGALATEAGLAGRLALGLMAAVTMAADLVALGWFGMWMGLTSRNANFATLKTYCFVQIVPYFAVGFVSSILMALVAMSVGFLTTSTSSGSLQTLMPLLVALVPSLLYCGKDVVFVLWARRKLYSRFREVAAQSVAPIQLAALPVTRPVSAPPMVGAEDSP